MEHTHELAEEIGYELSYSTREGVLEWGGSPFNIPRINGDGRYSAEVSVSRIKEHH